ncbi:uncharacterized protein METZ01_LOCUS158770 [marine metagenome]|uniref:Uncharacterized protein n=1 Tax=marine metagenome TaxID=408172 RepID=A0A382AWI9_9ZZZZ
MKLPRNGFEKKNELYKDLVMKIVLHLF